MHWQVLWGLEHMEGRRHRESICLWSAEKLISREARGRGDGQHLTKHPLSVCFFILYYVNVLPSKTIEKVGGKVVTHG